MDNASITLQINVSPGDSAYLHQTIPALISKHRDHVDEVLLILVLNRPQRTRLVDPTKRFPTPDFENRAQSVLNWARQAQSIKLVDRIEVANPSSLEAGWVYDEFLGKLISETHDYGGSALLSYFLAFSFCRTQYLLHYDADILLYQDPDFAWPLKAISALHSDPSLFSVSPRFAPPLELLAGPTRLSWPPFKKHPLGWTDRWFSTRCFLCEIEKISQLKPLIQGWLLLEIFVVKYMKRGFPRSPEVILSHRIKQAGGWRLILEQPEAWYLHPQTKDADFRVVLPSLIQAINKGHYPAGQAGYPDLNLDAWGYQN